MRYETARLGSPASRPPRPSIKQRLLALDEAKETGLVAIVKTAETMEAMAFVVIVVALGAWFGLLGWADWADTGLEFWASMASLGSHVTTQPMAGLAERLEQGEVVMSLRPTEGPGRP